MFSVNAFSSSYGKGFKFKLFPSKNYKKGELDAFHV